jgi:hypothetical protein
MQTVSSILDGFSYMKYKSKLLLVDAFINLALGVPLTFFPRSLPKFLGLPISTDPFYPSMLGAILTGIGMALVIERYKPSTKISGLGLEGAIVINLLGGLALIVWLVSGHLYLPPRGVLLLWVIAILVFGIAILELLMKDIDETSGHSQR